MSLLPSLLCESRPALHCILDAAGALYATTLFFGIINSIVVQPVVAEERAVSYRWAQCLAGPACSTSTRKPSRQQEGNICVCAAPCPGMKVTAWLQPVAVPLTASWGLSGRQAYLPRPEGHC